MRKFLVGLFLIFGVTSASAANLQAVAWGMNGLGCTGGDWFINLLNSPPGSGTAPQVPVQIVGYQIHSTFQNPNDYVVIGHTAPWGDYNSPLVFGPGNWYNDPYAAVNSFPLNPGANISLAQAAVPGDTTIQVPVPLPSWLMPAPPGTVYTATTIKDITNPAALGSTSVEGVDPTTGTMVLSAPVLQAIPTTDVLRMNDEIHIHYECQANENGLYGFTIVLFYTTPPTSPPPQTPCQACQRAALPAKGSNPEVSKETTKFLLNPLPKD